MKKDGLAKIDAMFKCFSETCDGEIMPDGILDESKYQAAPLKILWVLKQDINWGAEDSYADRIKRDAITGSPTWRRMSFVSYGLLSRERNFSRCPEAKACSEYLLSTAVIELNKELGDSRSPAQDIADGFIRYKELIFLQIDVYEPDVIIVCVPEGLGGILDSLYRHSHGCDFTPSLANAIVEGADVAIGGHFKPLFLWAYHPQATKGFKDLGISDESYTVSLWKAFDRVQPGLASV